MTKMVFDLPAEVVGSLRRNLKLWAWSPEWWLKDNLPTLGAYWPRKYVYVDRPFGPAIGSTIKFPASWSNS